MLVETMTYIDFDGEERTEDFYFNLTEAEAVSLSVSKNGGYERWIQSLIDAKDGETLIEEFSKVILKAYGKKSLDGRRFIKSPELSEEFRQTQAFSDLIMKFLRHPETAGDFLRGIAPSQSDIKTEIKPATTAGFKDEEVVVQ